MPSINEILLAEWAVAIPIWTLCFIIVASWCQWDRE